MKNIEILNMVEELVKLNPILLISENFSHTYELLKENVRESKSIENKKIKLNCISVKLDDDTKLPCYGTVLSVLMKDNLENIINKNPQSLLEISFKISINVLLDLIDNFVEIYDFNDESLLLINRIKICVY
ncbi:hypothetical protein PC5_00014 [Campylobacter phage PC5]|uniref:Uncharacterized protein n=3 Tax=Fletchervirus TaxID=1636618 RepID=A0A1B0XVG7_9CAUD|nr:hypothetical protein NCTC12673_gp007 [Campylobacter phage NCTC12673]YP_009321663.1 hypothetical protein BOX06_gp064 [Campylobacter phage PC14]ANH51136.1 hypothetical protein PC5_00014 [Campylobacter phage PC5]AVR55702.1 hypothetical protein [Campylobacter phage CP39]AEA86355.1 hypothetical protein [Campylobacter phage NCTC12673]ANH51357.1 hypothetical protein PC14_00064 [Campylobacter phage PC14]